MRRIHTGPESTATGRRGGALRAVLVVVSVLVLYALLTTASASAAVAVRAGNPALCGFSPKIAAVENPMSSLSSDMAEAMASPAAFMAKLKASFAAIKAEESAVESAAPSSLHGDFVTVFGVVNKLIALIGKSNNFMSLEASAPKLEADVDSTAFKNAAAAIRAWFTAHHCMS